MSLGAEMWDRLAAERRERHDRYMRLAYTEEARAYQCEAHAADARDDHHRAGWCLGLAWRYWMMADGVLGVDGCGDREEDDWSDDADADDFVPARDAWRVGE